MSPRFRGAAVAVALAALTAAAIVVGTRIIVAGVERMIATDDLVVHTHEVMQLLQQLQQSLVDAETGERCFIITGDERYLEPYLVGRALAERQLDRLAALTRDNPSQRGYIAAIAPIVASELGHLDATIALRRTTGFDASRAAVLSGESRRLMERLRVGVANMISHESALLEERTRASAAAARRAVASTLLGGFASLTLLAFAFEVARRRLRERARAAVRAHEEKERFRITLASVGDAVVVTDRRGNVTMLNPTAARLMQCGNEIIGRSLDEAFRIVNEETRQPVQSPVHKVLRDGKVAGLANHTVLLLPDGGEVPIDDSAAPILREDGTIVGVVLVFRDIRGRREAERSQQRAAEILKEQDRRKDRFLAMLSHELRNPLSPMRYAVGILQHEGTTAEQQARALAVLDHQLTHVSRLVDDLLDVSRIAQGKIRFRKEPVDLSDLVRRTAEDLRSVFARKRIALQVQDGAAALWVDADATRLAQVTSNLLQNAAKFTDPGGRVIVALARDGDRAVLEVRDNGAGMDAATLGTLFRPFVQAEETRDRSASGLGLGLALSKSIVELHGGAVRASSPGPGKGAAFVVELPLLRNAAVTARPDARRKPDRSLRILVIDDDEDSGATLRDLLELERHQVSIAADAESGIDAALQLRPDVLLCDVGLPGMDGYEAARRLRLAGSTAMLVALTGHASSEDVERAREAGFDHHLAKPVDVSTLLDVLAMARRADTPELRQTV